MKSTFRVAALPLFLAAFSVAGQELTIQSIEINQALGVQKGGALKFVANKDTVIRAFLSQEVTVNNETTSVAVTRDGTQVVSLAPRSYDTPVRVVDFLCPTLAACGNWAAGSYVFNVKVNGVEKSTDGTQYNFVERRSLRVLALPVKANYNGTITQVPNDKWKQMWEYTARVYPVAKQNFKWVVRDEFDASAAKFNLETDNGQRELWQALTNLQPEQCGTNPQAEGCFELIVGFISDRPGGYPNGTLQGYTFGRPTNLVVAKDEDAEATVAHEIAHIYKVGDTYTGGSLNCAVNPAPDGMKGKDWDDRSKEVSCNQGRQQFPGVDATLIPRAQNPYEVGGRGALGDMACYMGSGGKQAQFWTTQDAYDHLFNSLPPATPPSARDRLQAAERYLSFLGYLSKTNAVTKEPWETFTSTDILPDTTGTLMIRAVDAGGATISSQKLNVEFWILSTPPNPIREIDPAPFEGALRLPAAAAKVQIVQNGSVIYEVPVSTHAPVVTSVSPVSEQLLSGPYTVSWVASDLDGDALTATVEYNADVTDPKSEWIVLEGDLDGSSYALDFQDLPGSGTARIRVRVTDGILSGSAESAIFSVPAKPPAVFIDDPEFGLSYEIGDDVILDGDAADLYDDKIPDSSLVWSSNRSGVLGTGTSLITSSLPAGEHVITLAAINSKGLSGSASLTIHIGSLASEFVETPDSGAPQVPLNVELSGRTINAVFTRSTLAPSSLVTLEAAKSPGGNTPPERYEFAGVNFRLGVQTEDAEGDLQDVDFTSNTGIQVTLGYPVPLPGGSKPAGLRLFRFDSVTETWTEAAGACSPQATYDVSVPGQLTTRVCRSGLYSLVFPGVEFYTIQPCRLIDTRTDSSIGGQWGPPNIVPNSDLDPYTLDRAFTGTAAPHCMVPPDATALSVIVTALNYDALGRFTIYPADVTTRPGIATVNYRMADGIANVGTVLPLSADGKFRVFSNRPADLIIDVNGYYLAPSVEAR